MADLELFAPALHALARAEIDWTTADLRVALMTHYLPNINHASFSVDILANGTEHATANGYTQGGEKLTGATVTRVGANTRLSCDDVTWVTTGALTARYAVIYDAGTDNTIGYVALSGGQTITATDTELKLVFGGDVITLRIAT